MKNDVFNLSAWRFVSDYGRTKGPFMDIDRAKVKIGSVVTACLLQSTLQARRSIVRKQITVKIDCRLIRCMHSDE